jgi:hypothetical protein
MQLKNKLYLFELREQLLQKLIDDWPSKWVQDFDEFQNFEIIKSKNAFLEALLLDIEQNIYSKLNGDSKKYLFSKDFLRRFIFEYAGKEVRIQSHSRTAIAIYLGYNNWEHFIEKNPDLESQPININYVNVQESFLPSFLKREVIHLPESDFIKYNEIKQKSKIIKYLAGILGMLAASVCVFYSIKWWQNRPFSISDLAKVKFEVIKTVGTYPQAVRFRFDISALPNINSVEVETGVGTILANANYLAEYLNSNNLVDTLSQTYFYPGIYKVHLLANKKIIKTLNHIVYSKPNKWTSWGYGVAYEKDWITNISTNKSYINNGVVHFDPAELPTDIKNETDLRNAVHVLTKNFGVGLDSLQIEARMKNPENEGGESCYDMHILVSDKNFNSISAKFTMEGCTDFASLMAGKSYFRIQTKDSKNIDLDNFGVNQDEWNVFKLVVKGKNLTVYVNKKLAFKGNFETKQALNELIDTRISFKGAGSIDWVKIANSYTGKIIYQTDFDN